METEDGAQVAPRLLEVRSLLACLCAHRGAAVSSGRLIEALWSGTPPQTASTALHVYVSQLRKQLRAHGLDAAALVTPQPPGYRLRLGGCELDVHAFDRLLGRPVNSVGRVNGKRLPKPWSTPFPYGADGPSKTCVEFPLSNPSAAGWTSAAPSPSSSVSSSSSNSEITRPSSVRSAPCSTAARRGKTCMPA